MSDSNFKKKYKERVRKRSSEANTVRKIVAIVLTTLIVIIVVGGLSGFLYVKSALKPVDSDDNSQKHVKIPLGSSTSQIASILEKNEIIKNDLIFRFYTKFNNESGFQAGDYQFTSSMTLDEIISSLQEGQLMKKAVAKVTIPEGKTVEQIAEIYADEFNNITKKQFMDKVTDKKYVQQLIKAHPELLSDKILNKNIKVPLEGYLFAATYPFYVSDPSIDQIIESMLKKSETVILPYKKGFAKQDLSIHEGVTMASLVENEATTAKERKKIAEVFYNRMDEDMRLQTDPTVLYAMGKWKEKVLSKDLKVDSPYNTYQIKGLPAGPISNFHTNSLEAVANPDDNDFLYFLADSDGNVHYAKTLKKHNEFKKKYIK
ncbi:endolytic transglycosylase MltG [Halobacillus salinarum]|uniref:Endolytic murein transglycosylase n=1 Tax=Halobacillus salinarum TaxID=2932257 RepID=A0ABY4EPA6_9BACI|nr:endolytic transglycosylase MltG [Halobacillus salinarum]UOQ46299.1 endolytic transglycosylase MltG [Halobacillus salinarum]